MKPFARLLDLPYLLLAFPPLFWAGNVIVGRAVRGEIPPLSINWWRWVVAAAILLLFLHRPLWRQRAILLRHWKLILLLSATGILAFHSGVYVGLNDTTAMNAALIIALGPVLIVPLAWVLLGERPTALQGLGVLLSCLGVIAVISRADLAALAALTFNRGDLWLLFASACWGTYSVLLKLKPAELDVLVMLVAIMLLGAVMTTPFYIWEMASGLTVPLTAESFAVVGYVSIFAAVFAYIAWNRGVNLVGPNKAGLYLHLIPVYAAVLASLFLGERVEVYHLAGVVFILAGLVLTTRYGPKTDANERSAASAKTR